MVWIVLRKAVWGACVWGGTCSFKGESQVPCDVWVMLMCPVGLVPQGNFLNLMYLNGNVIASKRAEK